MKFALAYAAVLTLLFGCLREESAKNAGLPLVQAKARSGFVCTPTVTPSVRLEQKTAGWV